MGYYINQTVGYAFIVAAVAVLLLLVIMFARLSKLKRKGQRLEEDKRKLLDKNKELEVSFENAKETMDELTAKCEELNKNRENMKRLAYTDYLTELPNRIAFTEMLDNVMLTLRSDEIVAILDIDIDNFKNINDTQGHSYGDELLIDVTYRLKQVMDSNDYLARIGGDEFIFMTQNLNETTEIEEKIKKIKNVFSYPFVLSTKEYFVTVSIGVAFAPKDGKTSQVLIKNCDSAMYVAKANGKNTHAYFDPSFNQKLTEKIELQSELRKAIERKEFEVYYQPQMDLIEKKVIGFEALLRWKHPTKGLVYPNDFIPYAEENGLIIPIGNWVLKTACKQLKEWHDAGHVDLRMAVNLSARQFMDNDIVNSVKSAIEESEIDPHKLELEITESIALNDLDYTISTIRELKSIGVNFSLDDFGTGYSSMNYLKRLPVNNLKIDKSFLNTVMEDTCDQKIVQTIINLARILELDVIAEGVETSEQETFLTESNCDKAQGYLYSKPVPSEVAEQLLD
ncbi:MAG: EAL domain-containing protein [Clostridiales bacterium]|nr:EAL domain-containing protein [Clostridiales bacterium]